MARADHDPRGLRRLRSAAIGPLAYPGSVATGAAALALHGVLGLPTDIRPEVTLPDGTSRAGRSTVRVRRLPVRRWDVVRGIPCVTVEDALAQAVPELRRHEAVAVMDSALQGRLITRDGLERAHDAARGRPGAGRTHPWWDEADGAAESPAETWARLSCRDAGVPPDALQLMLVDGPSLHGRFLARVDLAWLLPDGRALIVEIDGQDPHSTPEALFRDRARQNRIVTDRTVVRRYTGTDALRGTVAHEVAAFLRSTTWTPGRQASDVFAV
ncbi:hypothetical protein [Isoptericola sp. BMS4]|uniref:hypothetical protein n=1 Tax=Isoptericola sp. BMS4 TaxID=2527875 RepID=UPI001F10AE5F|nr:hypothetical protein [Isoptericola sp. BMS4]